jgi:hypothetical protein
LGCRKPYLAISHKKRQKPDEAIFRHKPSHNYQIDKNDSFSIKTSIFFPGLDFSELNLTYLDISVLDTKAITKKTNLKILFRQAKQSKN